MPTRSTDVAYDLAKSAFEAVFGVEGKRFGSTNSEEHGVCDDAKGVQWNIYVSRGTGEAWLGVNLEGKEYDGWPIAAFIERELSDSKLLQLITTMTGTANISVALYRDAWQFESRPPIKQQLISDTEVQLNHLTAATWQQMLEEAYTCLHPAKSHRGRVKQRVTIIKNGLVKEMYVSPHLNIHTRVWDNPPTLMTDAERRVAEACRLLLPIHEIVTSQAIVRPRSGRSPSNRRTIT